MFLLFINVVRFIGFLYFILYLFLYFTIIVVVLCYFHALFHVSQSYRFDFFKQHVLMHHDSEEQSIVPLLKSRMAIPPRVAADHKEIIAKLGFIEKKLQLAKAESLSAETISEFLAHV